MFAEDLESLAELLGNDPYEPLEMMEGPDCRLCQNWRGRCQRKYYPDTCSGTREDQMFELIES